MALENYVKFLRGTPAAYENLTPKDNDTLYFISETNSSTGVLYLGSKLIAGGTVTSATKLADLSDVLLSEGIEGGSLLVYENEKWVNKTLDKVFSEIMVMLGASETTDGAAGLVPVPTKGQHNLFLRGDATWAKPIAELSVEDKQTIINLQSSVGTLVGEDTGKSMREVAAEEVAKIVAGADANFDTLKEIADWISNDTTGAASMANDISLLKTTIGSLSTSLEDFKTTVASEYVSKIEFNATVGDLSKLQSLDEEGNPVETNLVDEIVSLQKRMQWQELK